ncbi:DsbC family protein [Pseudoxanthomonas dokdonensis]|uniref:Thiol:disulfide interchange protein n=1 Tax=Pseudoxanthomonas dokdonensis TaxID=344882 RepID=A0A0R0CJE6_9GAMM|nr:DsbC family protein [Pseudoxanthomonas dokdonensis]KRG69648.1 hypothetical protein ABB29_09270 [Pseudoxanthomonas dokdonensis]
MSRFILAALSCALSVSACAQAPQAPGSDATAAKSTTEAKPATAGSAESNVRNALKGLEPNLSVDYVGKAPLPGFQEVIAGGQLLYISDDGRYLVQGGIVDLKEKKDLTGESRALSSFRVNLLKSVPTSERIVFAPPNPKYTVSVFTDVECGYCRKLHSEIGELNKQGIAVEYLAFPRMGLGSKDHKEMISVWCADDRKQALTDSKNGKPVPTRDCTNPVSKEYALGQRIGVSGTPAIYAPDGTQIGGYLSPTAMRARLDDLAKADAGTPAGMK